MKLKMLKAQLRAKEAALTALDENAPKLEERRKELETRADKVDAAGVDALNAEVEAFEADVASDAEKRAKLTSEIADREERAASSAPPLGVAGGGADANFGLRAFTQTEKRERARKALQNVEVREFFTRVIEAAQKRAVSNADILVPEVIINMIDVDRELVGNIYKLTNHRVVNGDANIIIAGDVPDAVWLDSKAALTELDDLDFDNIELSAYKVGGFISVHNSELDDAMIDLAAHIVENLSVSIAKAVDKAILSGTGAANKQPEGILNTPEMKTVTAVGLDYADVLAAYSNFPDDAGNLTAVMTRPTYFTYIAPQTIQTTASGRVVGVNADNSRSMPDGTPVVFVRSEILGDGKMLIGDFKKYMLAERQGMRIARSSEVRFVEEQTLFKATRRLDGKVVKPGYFVLIDGTETVEEQEE